MSPTANFNYPASYRLGCGRISELSSTAEELSITRPLVVTDAGVQALPWFPAIVDQLTQSMKRVEVFADAQPNPTETDVTAGLERYRQGQCDGIILIGGGSAMDVGKCIALLADNPGSVFDYEDIGDNWKKADANKIAPMIAVPTTAGTGSEVGRASIIIDAAHQKKIIFHPKMQPPVVLADPELTFGLPPALTAFTGLDAFVHCFEAFCVPSYHPMADGIALEGMRLIYENLGTAVKEGNHAEARSNMMMASTMGATAFQKGLGIVHAIAHALGGRYRVHHGLANAILLPHCMHFNQKVIEERCTIVARHLQLASPSFDSLLTWVLEIRSQLGVPHTLETVDGFSLNHAADLAPIALDDPSMSGNPRPATQEEMIELIRVAAGKN